MKRRGGEKCSATRGLEADPQSKLHLPGVVALGIENAKGARSLQIEQWIEELHVVQHVGKDHLKFGVHTLGDEELLLEAEVHVPVGQSSERANAASPVVDSQNGGANLTIDGNRIGEHVGSGISRSRRGGSHVVAKLIGAAGHVEMRRITRT